MYSPQTEKMMKYVRSLPDYVLKDVSRTSSGDGSRGLPPFSARDEKAEELAASN